MSGTYKILMAGDSKARLEMIGEINWWKNSSNEFTRSLKELEKKGVTDVSLYINSGGGSVFDANEIVNQLKSFKGTKSLASIGALCASAATTVALAFDEVEMSENGMFMIHEPTISPGPSDEKRLNSWKEALAGLKVYMVKAYMEKTGKSEKEIRRMMDVESWMNADKALAHGFIDSISGKATEDDVEMMSGNLQAFGYRHTPTMYSNNQPKEDTMFKSVLKGLGLPENATEQEAKAKLDAFMARLEVAEKAKAELLIDNAIAQKKIPLGEREQYVQDAIANYDLVERLVKNLQAPVQASKSIVPAGRAPQDENTVESLLKKPDLSWKDIASNMDTLEAIRNNHQEVYMKLYKDHFGVECKIED